MLAVSSLVLRLEAASFGFPSRDRIRLWVAKIPGVVGPFSEADCDHVGDDAADIDLLCRVVVRAGVVARHRHRPGVVAGMQAGEKPCRIVHVLARVEHVSDAAKMRSVIVVVDLHAAEIDQCLAVAARPFKTRDCFIPAFGEYRFSFYIQGVRLQASFLACFGQADGVEDSGGDSITVGGAQDFGLAGVCGRFRRRRNQAR